MLFTVFTVFRISVRFNWDNGADANFAQFLWQSTDLADIGRQCIIILSIQIGICLK